MLISTFLCSCSVNSPYSGLRPSEYSKAEVKEQIIEYYKEWSSKYIKDVDEKDEKYVYYKADKNDNDDSVTVSEAHGYGMLILVNMANIDSKNSEEYKNSFDAFIRFYNSHRSPVINEFMCWQERLDENGYVVNIDGGSSAADGDLDIAYSLILANELWGSQGEYDYLDIAKNIIGAFRNNMIASKGYIYVGDSVLNHDKYVDLIRSSDFIMDAFYKFKVIDEGYEQTWQNVIDEIDSIMDDVYINYSFDTGLMPDFILNTKNGYIPATGKQLESENDGDFGYNACRTWFRVGEYALYNKESKYDDYLKAFSSWTDDVCDGNPSEFNAGYYLVNGEIGTPLPNSDYESLAFSAPLLISASVAKNQEWYDDIYEYVLNKPIDSDGYFGNTIKMLILISGTGNKIY